MLTQCPGCQTVFRVTSTILRAAHGQVRCGRCNTQFDAIERLLDGEDPPPDTTVTSTSLQVEEALQHEAESLSHEDIVLEGNRIEISGVYRRAEENAAEADADMQHTQTVIEEFNIGTEEWENPFDQDADSANNDESETELEDVEQELSAVELADALAGLDASTSEENDNEPTISATSPFTTAPMNANASATASQWMVLAPDDELFAQPFAEPAPQRRWPWAVAGGALFLLLTGQVLHHFRETLARHQSFGPQLTRLYAAIGQPLEPQWQLQAYSIKQWGIVSDPQESGTLRVRASVTNGASFAQPYPLLQLSLEDRFGGKVGTREFKPEEYLASNTQATRLLAAGESANIDLAIIDPGPDAIGFQFDTCLLLKSNLQCSHDAALKQL